MRENRKQLTSRRTYLRIVGATGIAGLAGCSGEDGGDGGNGGNGGSDDGGTDDGADDEMDDGGTDDSEDGSDEGTATDEDGGESDGDGEYHVGFANMGLAGDPWMESFQNGAKWYAEDHGIDIQITDGEFDAAKQVEDIRNLLLQDIDALMTSPVDSEALASVVNEAHDQGVPVFTANSTANSDNIQMFTAFGNRNAAARAGEELVARLEERYGAPEGRVVEVLLPQTAQTFVDRHEGFIEVANQHDGIEIVNQLEYDQTREDATNQLTTQLQDTPDIDAIYCPDLLSGLAAVSAMENEERYEPIGNEDHITVGTLDASPTVLDEIQAGFFDFAVDQPNLFYGPITLKFIVDFLDAGEDPSVLPEIGTEVTSSDLEISGSERFGVDPWAESIWAPAEVTENEFEGGSHPFFRTQEVLVTEENADAGWLWGNISREF